MYTQPKGLPETQKKELGEVGAYRDGAQMTLTGDMRVIVFGSTNRSESVQIYLTLPGIVPGIVLSVEGVPFSTTYS